MATLFLQHGSGLGPFLTELVTHKVTDKPKDTLNSLGHGSTATEYMVKYEGHWRRVYYRYWGGKSIYVVNFEGAHIEVTIA